MEGEGGEEAGDVEEGGGFFDVEVEDLLHEGGAVFEGYGLEYLSVVMC